MKQKRNFCKRLLTFMLCLALVITSVNIPTLTVQAAQTPTDGSLTKPFGESISYNATDKTIDVDWGNAGGDYTYCVSITGQDTSYKKVYDDLTLGLKKYEYEDDGSWEAGKTYLVELQCKKYDKYSEAVSKSITIPDPDAGGSTEGGTESGGATDIPADPTGLVAEYWANDDINQGKIRVAWGPTSGATYWTVFIDGDEVSESTELVYFAENIYAAGKHPVKLVAHNAAGSSKNAAEAVLELTAEQAGGDKEGTGGNEGGGGTGDGNEGGGEQPTEVPGQPFGLEIGFEQDYTKISLVWGAPTPMPDGWKVYIDDVLVGNTKSAGGNLYDNIYSEGEHTVKLVAYNSIGDSEPLEVPFTLTAEQAGDKGIATEEDKAKLQKLYEEEIEFSKTEGNEEKYTPSTWSAYTKAIKDAKEVLDDEEATKKRVNEAYNNLVSAKEGLKEDTAEDITVVVSEQLKQAFVGNNVVLTYVANTRKFKFNNYKVKIDGKEVSTDGITVGDSTITLPAGLFSSKEYNQYGCATYTIQFEQTNCTFSPVYQTVYETGSQAWNLEWQDEFNGTALDTTKWDYQTGDGTEYSVAGWGNEEKEIYTSNSKNSSVSDGTLTITAKKEANGTYSSARIRTVTEEIGEDGKAGKGTALKADTFGKIEAKIKMPKGQGIWPAFWMLPYNSEYGTWAASGELDIMEARGRLPETVCGTIHYGGTWPNNVSTGNDYYFPKGEDITGYHIYGVEWDPNEIRWYVDGNVYSTLSNWYAEAGDDGNWPYPAPFDEKFYILFNLAVGGTFDSFEGDIPVDENGVDMDVDYVRWYQKEGGYNDSDYMEPEVDKDVSEEAQKLLAMVDENGNYIKDADFAEMGTDPKTNPLEKDKDGKWFPLLTAGGAAAWSKVKRDDGTNALKVSVTNAGSQTYSVQMIQYFPMVKGYSYEITYDAYTDSTDRKGDVTLQIGGDEEQGWSKYSGSYTDELTMTPTTYKHKFTMKAATDPHARFEFNLATSEGNVYLSNVCVKLLKDGFNESDDEDDPKTPLADGNHIYNGNFNTGSDSLLYWHWTDNDNASIVKNGGKGNRVADITVTGSPVSIWQYGINLLQTDEYKLTFKVNSADAQNVKIVTSDKEGKEVYKETTIPLEAGEKEYTWTFTQPEDKTDIAAKLMFTFEKSVELSSVKLIRTTDNNFDWDEADIWPMYNGDFSNGTDRWNIWSETGGWEAHTVNDDGMLEMTTVKVDEGANFWCVGIQSKSMWLAKGLKWRVKFDYVLDSPKTYILELAGEQRRITLGAGSDTYVSEPFDGSGACKFTLYLGATPSNDYKFLLDNVIVYLDDSNPAPDGYKQPVSISQDGKGKAGSPVVVNYSEDDKWADAEKVYYLNGEEIDSSKVDINKEKRTLTIDASYFPEANVYDFAVKANGYVLTNTIKLTVLDESGNFLVNGDFSLGNTAWSFYSDSNCGEFNVNDNNVAVITHKWNVGNEWDIQLFQEGLEYDAGDYVVCFDAWADVERPIGVQLQNGNNVVAGTGSKVSLTTEKKSYKVIWKGLGANSGVKLDFPMGAVVDGGLTTPNAGDDQNHNIYIDNVVFRLATEADINGQPGTIAATAGAAAIGDAVAVTYVEANNTWKAAEKVVYVNRQAVAADKIKETATGLTIDGSLFQAEGRYAIYIVAKGFDATNTVFKNVLGADGNLIIGGDMNDASLWNVYNEDAGLSKGEIADGKYTLDYTTGYCGGEWNIWITWSSQLKKEYISVEAGKTYTLSFEAYTDLEGGRDIIIELSDGGQITQHIDQGTRIYEVQLPVPSNTTDEYSINMLLGPIGKNLQIDTSNAENNKVPHTLILDNFTMLEKGKVNKSILGNLLKDYEDAAKDDETFKEIYEAAEAVYNKNNATQDEIDKAVEALKAGYLVIAKAALADILEEYKNVTGEETDERYQAFKKAYDDAVALSGEEDASLAEIEKAISDLKKAYKTLTEEPEVPPVTVDKAQLNAMIEKYKDKTGDESDPNYQAFKEALEAAVEVSKDDNATQEEVDEALANLSEAYETLTGEEPDIPPVTDEVDKDDLNTILAKYADVEGDEADANYQSFKDAYAEAKEVSLNEAVTQDEVDDAVNAVKDAYLAYVKALLETDVDAYDKIEQEAYDDDTWTAFQTELAKAHELLDSISEMDDVEVAADMIVAETDALEEAHRALTREGLWVKVIPDQTYTGSAIKPSVEVWEGETILTEKKDYTVSYKNNTKVGTAQVTVKGKGNYNGQSIVEFRIEPKDIEELDVADVYAIIDKKGKVKNPKVTVKYGKKTVTIGDKKDCTITYLNVMAKDDEGKESAVPGVYDIIIEARNEKAEDGTVASWLGNYCGTKTIKYTVLPNETILMSKANIVLTVDGNKCTAVDYAGEDTVQPDVAVTYGSGNKKVDLTEENHYELKYVDSKQVGIATVKVIAKAGSGYYGTKTATYTVKGTDFKTSNIIIAGIDDHGYTYTGDAIRIDEIEDGLVLTDKKRENYSLVKGTDYQISYSNNINAGKKASITFEGMGSYAGSKITKNFTITALSLDTRNSEGSKLSWEYPEKAEAVYTKTGAVPDYSLKFNGEPLAVKADYTVSYSANKAVGSVATIKITGKGNFAGTFSETYEVTKPTKEIITNGAVYAEATDIVVPAKLKNLKTSLKVYERSTGKALNAGTDYEKTFNYYIKDEATGERREVTDDDLKVDAKIFVEVTLKNNYSGTDDNNEEPAKISTSFRLYNSKQKASSFQIVVVNANELYYTGRPITPNVEVYKDKAAKNTGEKLEEGTDYELSITNNIQKGKGKITVTGIGNGYGGTKTVTFTIKNKPMTINHKIQEWKETITSFFSNLF